MSDPSPNPPWADCLQSIGVAEDRRALVALVEWIAGRVGELLARGRAANDQRIVVVLVSRRMSCLYEMLVANGFPGFEGATVVSDRALGGSVRLVPTDSVVLVDDAIILGTTLVDLYDRIVKDLGDDRDRIDVRVAWIDRQRHSPALADRLRLDLDAVDGPLKRSTKELESIAWDIASALYQAGRPYFTDFPLVKSIDGSSRTWAALTATGDWMVAEVTPPREFSGGERRAFTFIPTEHVDRRLRTRICPAAAPLLETAKVRVYLGPPSQPGNGHHVSLRVVPMGLPGAMMPERLDAVLDDVEAELGATGLRWREDKWTPVARHRLLQMYLSSCVLAEFWEALTAAGCAEELTPDRLERQHLLCYFGAEDTRHVLGGFERSIQRYLEATGERAPVPRDPVLVPHSGLADAQTVAGRAAANGLLVHDTPLLADRLDLLANAVPPKPPSSGEIVRVDPIWVHRVLSLFGFVDENLERPQEKKLRALRYEQYEQYRKHRHHSDVGDRVIKMGISLPELRTLLSPDVRLDDPWSRSVLLLAIDVGNDLGVIVPTTIYDEDRPGGAVWRYYRSGEMAFATNMPHDQIDMSTTIADAPSVDRYTEAWLNEGAGRGWTREEALRRFLAETAVLIEETGTRNPVQQAWLAEVTRIDASNVEVYAESRLTEGLTTRALLPRDLLSPTENQSLAVGTELLWTVFRVGTTPSGHNRYSADVRVAAQPVAS